MESSEGLPQNGRVSIQTLHDYRCRCFYRLAGQKWSILTPFQVRRWIRVPWQNIGDTKELRMTRVYVDMVADLFHYGHVELLRQARALGDYLLVGIHADEVVLAHKRKPILTMEERVACVAGCRYVDEVLPNAPWATGRDWIESHDIHLVAHGSDYSQEDLTATHAVPIEMGIFRIVDYTTEISTTEIIRRILEGNR